MIDVTQLPHEEADTIYVIGDIHGRLDLLKGKKPIASTAHGHGPICTGIRKMVDFPLERGRHVLQIAGSPGSTIPVMVARLP